MQMYIMSSVQLATLTLPNFIICQQHLCFINSFLIFQGHDTGQVSHWPLTTEGQVQSQANPGGICGGQSCIWTGFALNTYISPSESFHQCSIFISFTYHQHYTIWATNSITTYDATLFNLLEKQTIQHLNFPTNFMTHSQ